MTNFCEHCQGQRFDRARVLQALRQLRKELQGKDRATSVDKALAMALKRVTALEIPHLEPEEEEGEVVH